MFNLKKSQSKMLGPEPDGRLGRASASRARKKGLPPGTLVHTGKQFPEKTQISIMDYSETQLKETENAAVQDLRACREAPTTSWVNVEGLRQIEVIESIGKVFQLHPLVLEDIVNTNQRPKVEDHDEYLFIVIKMLSYNEQTTEIEVEQMSLILGKDYLLTFQETPGDDFDGLKERMRAGKERIRRNGPDYLAYSLIDLVVDNYFVILEKLAERIELLEEELVAHPTPKTLGVLHRLKMDLIFLRRSVWPLREVINRLAIGDTALIKQATLPYLRDLYDHTIHVIDTMETYRDIVSGMLDIYLSSISNRLNEIMKVLTMIATIFIPLTFLAGWYGMYFKSMPEYEWRWGYPMVIAVSVAVTIAMLIFFRRKKWL